MQQSSIMSRPFFSFIGATYESADTSDYILEFLPSLLFFDFCGMWWLFSALWLSSVSSMFAESSWLSDFYIWTLIVSVFKGLGALTML